ncbi:MAG TPA: OsmC family protein [Gemmatimonadales bacterium]|nr:OsmC family protein [Gemmatimonadales bacterium]
MTDSTSSNKAADTSSFSVQLTMEQGFQFQVEFQDTGGAPLSVDEAAPLGEGRGPNPSRLLAAAVGHCLSSSLLFCLRKARIQPTALTTTVTGTVARNERGRLRVSGLEVALHPVVPAADHERMARCLELFEDYCVVTQSVRKGIEVRAEVV